ncbi:DUF2971 domain-containing protein [Poseidonibacter antarcticus]|uniref:DUF2971 domain-containing protein n=1 Tax=Poseidonibacter antarcticus TaxID=2478538 RepID=UPI0013CF3FC5|nr:DUF2971 domain-containing protein [Poseidonibacter antarcticus]
MKIKNETLLYKYRDFGEHTNQIIKLSELYFASPNFFNDPFDCNLQFRNINSYSSSEIKKFKKKVLQNTKSIRQDLNKTKSNKIFISNLEKEIKSWKANSGILSLSLIPNNILMWSHYSNNHKGLCFGFKGLKNQENSLPSEGIKVEYSKNEDYELISVLDEDYEKELTRLFTIKSKDWKYEKEYRFTRISLNGSKEYGSKKFYKKCLKEIIFGYKAEKTKIKNIINLCQSNGFEHVEFKKAKLVPGKFALDFDKINKDDY